MKTKRCFLVPLVMLIVFIYGCSSTLTMQRGTPIRTENIGKLVKGKSTKSDVIFLFGMPTGGTRSTYGGDTVYSYELCTITSTGKGGASFLIPVVGVFTKQSGEAKEKCEKLSIMLDKNEIVKTFSYHPDDPINDDTISKLIKDKSTKYDVIELFGAPSTISISANDEVYMYKTSCITKSTMQMGLGKSESATSCKNLTILLDKNTGMVKTYDFFEKDEGSSMTIK